MELEIIERVDVKKKITVELPYYYKQEIINDDSDTVIYGKIEESRTTAINISRRYHEYETEFSVEVTNRGPQAHSCYFVEPYKSSEAEFLAAKEKLLVAAKSA